MSRIRQKCLLLAIFFASSTVPALAYPDFLTAYKADEYRRPGDPSCVLCHASASGGGERNAFGRAFEAEGERITPLLRAQFPDTFVYPTSNVSDRISIHFSDPGHKVAVLESDGQWSVIDVEKQAVDRKVVTATSSANAARPEPKAASGAITDPDAREGAFFGYSVVDLPNGKPLKKGGIDFWIAHRFPEDALHNSASDLFGFDSVATVEFGVRAALTDRLSVSVARTNSLRTIELASIFQASRQGDEMPVTLQLRASVEGPDNFHVSKELQWTGFAPSLQVTAVRTFADRLSVLCAPTFAFNTRNEAFPAAFEFGANSNNTIALGLGAGLRILRTTSLVAEWTPRLYGFRGERVDRPEISFGVQRATYRHTFELVLSNTRPMTTSRYPVTASDVFGIGFNIYRKVR